MELITPERARNLLALPCPAVFPFLESKVDYFVEKMLTGRWVEDESQSAIKVVKGELHNGRHRLTAIVRSGLSVWLRFREE